MIRVLIADDHPVVRRGIAQVLSEESDLEVAGQAADAEELRKSLRDDGADLVLLDLSMPGADGIQLIRELAEEHQEASILVLSIHSEEQYALRCLEAGASGYLNKQSAPENLVKAIRTVAGGRRYLSPEVEDLLFARLRGEEALQAPHESLSPREWQVMIRLAKGDSVTQIGEDLGLSVKTVSTYRTRLLEKMGLETNADLVRYALENELI